MTTHFVTRQIFTGSGKLGVENGTGHDTSTFQISQRADFFEEEVGLETTLRRPIINTRDEPHADALKYRRLHVIVGDANMSETATLVKVGSTQILLAMLEDHAIPDSLVLDDPLAAMSNVSRDISLSRLLPLANGSEMTAREIQLRLLSAAEHWLGDQEENVVSMYRWDEIIAEWKSLVVGLLNSDSDLADRIDWIAKKRLIDAFRDRHDLSPSDSRLKAIDLQYHDLRDERCLARRAGLRRFVDDQDVQRATVSPPSDTRAFFRGEMLRRWPDAIVAANWDSMVVDTGSGALVRIPMDEPGRGTKDLVEPLLRQSRDVNDVLRLLKQGSEQVGSAQQG
jgi:proteasome accessory factor A